MAVTNTLTKAVPYEKDSKVEEWNLECKYENDSEGDATYYTSTFSTRIIATETDAEGNETSNFTAKAKGDWTKSHCCTLLFKLQGIAVVRVLVTAIFLLLVIIF